ncbi:MAG: hypothetical protein OXF02_05155, partial [Simkaniaceae bacterium]|nr:hypothetical protein [Simkaniaceae bacterium]
KGGNGSDMGILLIKRSRPTCQYIFFEGSAVKHPSPTDFSVAGRKADSQMETAPHSTSPVH